MSRFHGHKLGPWLVAVLGVLGCGGALNGLPADEQPALEEAQGPAEAQAPLEAEWANRCRPAYLVKQVVPPSPLHYGAPSSLTALNGLLYFVTPSDADTPTQLWRSDATESGTYPIWLGIESALMKSGDRLYFIQDHGLWMTDGTTRGTTWVTDLRDGQAMASAYGLFQDVRGRLFFTVWHGGDGAQLWVTDGTDAGTLPLGTFKAFPMAMTDFRGRLFFSASTPETGAELWMSDGTPEGTRLFTELAPGPEDSNPLELTVVGSALYFTTTDREGGQGLWKVESLDPARTYEVRHFAPGSAVSSPHPLAGLNGKLLYTVRVVRPGEQTLELWRTDGTAHGSARLLSLPSPNPERIDLSSGNSLVEGNLLYFVVFYVPGPGISNSQLWRTDGTAGGSALLAQPLLLNDEGPTPPLLAVGRTLLFASYDDVPFADPRQRGQELWRTGGARANTGLLQDLVPGADSGVPFSYTLAGHYVFFVARDAVHGFQLWALPVDSVGCPGPLR